jgi:hypothetical protein
MKPITNNDGVGMESQRGRGEQMLPKYRVVWLEAPESATQLVVGMGGGDLHGAEGASEGLWIPLP